MFGRIDMAEIWLLPTTHSNQTLDDGMVRDVHVPGERKVAVPLAKVCVVSVGSYHLRIKHFSVIFQNFTCGFRLRISIAQENL